MLSASVKQTESQSSSSPSQPKSDGARFSIQSRVAWYKFYKFGWPRSSSPSSWISCSMVTISPPGGTVPSLGVATDKHSALLGVYSSLLLRVCLGGKPRDEPDSLVAFGDNYSTIMLWLLVAPPTPFSCGRV